MDADGMAVSLTATLGGAVRVRLRGARARVSPEQRDDVVRSAPGPEDLAGPRTPGAPRGGAGDPCFGTAHRGAVVGSPGGRRLISAVTIGVARLVDRAASVQEAMGGPGFHADEGPVTLDIRTPDYRRVAAGLEKRGHDVLVRQETALTGHFGRASGILRKQGSDGISLRARSGSRPCGHRSRGGAPVFRPAPHAVGGRDPWPGQLCRGN